MEWARRAVPDANARSFIVEIELALKTKRR
jgi:hypothetical protein